MAIVGSREFGDLEQVREYVRGLPQDTIIVSGGAGGVDITAEREAKAQGLNVEIYYPRWDLHGRGAGFARNRLIVAKSHRVVAFWDGKSRGTQHTVSVAKEMGRPCEVFGPRSEP